MKMVDVQVAVAIAIAFIVVLFVPGLVWATVIAGLYQLIRERRAAGRERAEDMGEALERQVRRPREETVLKGIK